MVRGVREIQRDNRGFFRVTVEDAADTLAGRHEFQHHE